MLTTKVYIDKFSYMTSSVLCSNSLNVRWLIAETVLHLLQDQAIIGIIETFIKLSKIQSNNF